MKLILVKDNLYSIQHFTYPFAPGKYIHCNHDSLKMEHYTLVFVKKRCGFYRLEKEEDIKDSSSTNMRIF